MYGFYELLIFSRCNNTNPFIKVSVTICTIYIPDTRRTIKYRDFCFNAYISISHNLCKKEQPDDINIYNMARMQGNILIYQYIIYNSKFG